MKTEPQILRHPLDETIFGALSIKILAAIAVVIALLALCGAIAEAWRRPSAGIAWLAGAALVAAIIAAVLVGSVEILAFNGTRSLLFGF